ncbi:MAG TPA: 3'(2'),5'-bisphosphate nucleotidase CysQ [Steroidobacteraceae bacterium]|nr:3'(2'),5'-bisphosphate nucleotidase CysQ [Steroidobacteraceae bacterium]
MASNPAELLPGVLDAVAAASTAILEVYASAHLVEYKADDSPITRADRAAHDILAARLALLAPAIPMLSEEAEAAHAHAVRGGWRELWLVDPLDGTKEFIGRNGEFTVNVALVRDHEPVLGVVAAPALGVTYFAARGHGAWCTQAGGEPKPIHVRPAADPLVVVGSRSHRGASLDGLLARLGPHEMRPMGSALKFCLVAEGAADFYPRLGPTSEWDTAAAQAVLEVAGGAVTALDGAPLRYNARDTLLNPHFIAYGDRTRNWPALF